MGAGDEVDFAHTDVAVRNRAAKARALAVHAWHRGLGGADLLALGDARRRDFARAAGVHPPSTLETWRAAELLDAKEAWAARHPGHPAAAREVPEERSEWI
ncbi:hypothetical protein CLV92_12318 [Kineococcus xinjiangensis]|uniref:Uncharacterized protein n=1 Tax=Kineococcus xinjiangensis TaxID=512762 RepID=A0A2S6IC74_9ACTN|nr:hypothetical protein [Kineococcus xinjiangensis]PPK90814.1 hypothetical protein CLV92_12318 [Kineococcus xinjiangensis]